MVVWVCLTDLIPASSAAQQASQDSGLSPIKNCFFRSFSSLDFKYFSGFNPLYTWLLTQQGPELFQFIKTQDGQHGFIKLVYFYMIF